MTNTITKGVVFAFAMSVVTASPAFAIADFQGGPFTVQEGSIPGTPSNLVTASGLNFSYGSRVEQGAAVGGVAPFIETGFLTKTGFVGANGAAISSSLLSPESAGGYHLYATYTITGTAAGTSAAGVTATFTSFDMTLSADPLSDTMFNAFTTTGGTGDDIPLATFTLDPARGGLAHAASGLASGDFAAIEALMLTPAGQAYFVSPNQYYSFENVSGNTATINGLTPPGAAFTAFKTGGGVELFGNARAVPEPASLALLGMGLIGINALRRRRKAA